jgi:iron complex transport system ATP-binding protein
VSEPVLELRGVGVRIAGRPVLAGVDWTVERDQRWVVLGPNGSGKTTLLRVASLYLFPTAGTVRVLGATAGRVDVRRFRTRIGLASAALGQQLRPDLTARDVVMTARHGALEPWWHAYGDADRAKADALLDRFEVGGREDLLLRLTGMAHDPATPPLVLVTHHADEIPEGFTHGLVLGAGRVVAQGPVDEVLTGGVLTEAFGLPLSVEHRDGRWSARAERA